MSILRKLKEYLNENNVKYIKISHSPAYTAQEIAASIHTPGKELAKTVIIKVRDSYAMAVLPATHRINFELLKKVVGTDAIRLADEKEFKDIFLDCEVGAMPPFGNLYNLPVYVASALSEDKEIVFNAGTHIDVIRMGYSDFKKLVKPIVANFSDHLG